MSEQAPSNNSLTISERIFATIDHAAQKHHGQNFNELVSKYPDAARRMLAHFIIESANNATTVIDENSQVVVNQLSDGQEATTNYARRLSPNRDIYMQTEGIVVNVVRNTGWLGKIMGRDQQLVHSITLNSSDIAN